MLRAISSANQEACCQSSIDDDARIDGDGAVTRHGGGDEQAGQVASRICWWRECVWWFRVGKKAKQQDRRCTGGGAHTGLPVGVGGWLASRAWGGKLLQVLERPEKNCGCDKRKVPAYLRLREVASVRKSTGYLSKSGAREDGEVLLFVCATPKHRRGSQQARSWPKGPKKESLSPLALVGRV